MKLKGINGRWVLYGITVLALLVIITVLVFSINIHNGAYDAARAGIEGGGECAAAVIIEQSESGDDCYARLYKYVSEYNDGQYMTVQMYDSNGGFVASSTSGSAAAYPSTKDVGDALRDSATSAWDGRLKNSEVRAMSVTVPVKYAGVPVGAVRYVFDLTETDAHVSGGVVAANVIGLVLLALMTLLSLLFMRTIVKPINTLTKVARQISTGSYGIQAEKKYNDEVGDLTDAINDMSVKIRQSERTQTEFISQISHELRTPLTAITGWSETLKYDDTISDDSMKGLQIISKEAYRLTKMVEELLEFTRIQDGRFTLNIEQIDIEAELEDAIFAYSELMKQENIKVAYSPSDDPLPLIPGDAERLRQVLLNILDNASKYGKNGGAVDISLGKTGDYVTITVRDYGQGILPEELPFVKNKFFKGSSKERGSGIGLAVCEEIVTRHGGDLIIENASGGGVRVTVRLPVTRY